MPDPFGITFILGGLALANQASKAMTMKPPQYPTATDPRVDERRQQQLRAELARKGRSSTILTGGGGLTEEASLGKATLLGR